jgi:serine/threonine-protein kinase ATR
MGLLALGITGAALLIQNVPTARAAGGPRKAVSKKDFREAGVVKTKLTPLFRDFMGLNVHSVGFKPELYKPVCRLVRDYHPMSWDLGDDTSNALEFPHTRNNVVNWLDEYGSWKKDGYDIDASLQFEQTAPGKWKDMAKDAFAYGRAFAQYFGPSGPNRLVGSVEIGNEPGNYSDSQYRVVFENMARGLREGDPRLPIATCNVVAGKPDRYTKNIESIKGLESLYDIINIHTYAFAEPYPTWRRSFPEDPTIKYLVPITDTIAWRNANAPAKQIWVTEFGWDSTTKPDLPTGDFSRWVGSTDTQQAQYLVRSFLVFSALDVDRAYLYYFNDDDTPTLHAASGLTRNYTPKPSYYAVSHLYHTLGNYRFARAVTQETGNLYVYEYQNATNSKDRIWAVWSPTGTNRKSEVVLPALKGKIVRAEQMPLQAGQAESVAFDVQGSKVTLTVGESPIYLWLHAK